MEINIDEVTGELMLVTNQLFPRKSDWKEVVIHGKFCGRFFHLSASQDSMSVIYYKKAKPTESEAKAQAL